LDIFVEKIIAGRNQIITALFIRLIKAFGIIAASDAIVQKQGKRGLRDNGIRQGDEWKCPGQTEPFRVKEGEVYSIRAID